MNILFILPNFPEGVKSYLILPSLEFSVMSSILKENGHKVSLLDMKINDYSICDLDRLLSDIQYDFICIESTSQDHCEAVKVIKECKRLNKDVPIALRGEISSFLPSECLEHIETLDYVMRFENEKTILALVNAIEESGNISNIPNIAYRMNGEIIVTPLEKPIENLNDLPYPDRKMYDIKKYYDRSVETIVRSTRGCPGKCSFCNKTKLSPFREFSLERFCDEIEELISLGFSQFFFSDDSFSYSEARVKEFRDLVLARNLKIRFTSNMRIVDVTDEKIKYLKEAGAYRFFVGIETINANSSKKINKNLSKEKILEKIEIIKKYDLEVHASFIVGNPGDTKEDLAETANFINELKPTLISLNKLKPLPGTDIYMYPEKYGVKLKDKYWFENDEWTIEPSICSTDELSAIEIDEWKRKLMISFMRG